MTYVKGTFFASRIHLAPEDAIRPYPFPNGVALCGYEVQMFEGDDDFNDGAALCKTCDRLSRREAVPA